MSEPAQPASCWLLGWKGWSLICNPGVAEVGAISGVCLVQHLPEGTQGRGNKLGFVSCFFSKEEEFIFPPAPLPFKEKKPFLGLHAAF